MRTALTEARPGAAPSATARTDPRYSRREPSGSTTWTVVAGDVDSEMKPGDALWDHSRHVEPTSPNSTKPVSLALRSTRHWLTVAPGNPMLRGTPRASDMTMPGAATTRRSSSVADMSCARRSVLATVGAVVPG